MFFFDILAPKVRIISYFCIVKQSLCHIFKFILVLFACFSSAKAQVADSHRAPLQAMDSVDISLLTCGPGTETWSLYGHSAIRVNNRAVDYDVAVNYGMFSFRNKFFVLRFIFGLTDYEMGIIPTPVFLEEYKCQNRWIVEQKLHLTRNEKWKILQALQQNALPENKTYRYNFLYDNCTTRARNIILDNLETPYQQVSQSQWEGTSYREMVHQWTGQQRWTQFGNDLLLGIKADFSTSKEASLFLPDSVRKEFNNIIRHQSGEKPQKLVSEEVFLHQGNFGAKPHISSNEHLTSPTALFLTLFMLSLLIGLREWRKNTSKERMRSGKPREAWLFDAFLLFSTGTAGVILLMMVFSQHPTVNLNLQILILNPLSLIFLYPAARVRRKGNMGSLYWKFLGAGCLLFLIGSVWQTYAEGMYLLALTLLFRSISNSYSTRHEK